MTQTPSRDWQKDMEEAFEQQHKVDELKAIVKSYDEGEYMPVTSASWYFDKLRFLLDVMGQHKNMFEQSYQRGLEANVKIGEHIARADAAEEREKRLKETLERIAAASEDVFTEDAARHTLRTLYPDTPAPKEGTEQ